MFRTILTVALVGVALSVPLSHRNTDNSHEATFLELSNDLDSKEKASKEAAFLQESAEAHSKEAAFLEESAEAHSKEKASKEAAFLEVTYDDHSKEASFLEHSKEASFLEHSKEASKAVSLLQNPLPFLKFKENIDCSKNTNGGRLNNLVGESASDSFTTSDVTACQTACGALDTCNAFTFYTGTSEHGKCVMVSYCGEHPQTMDGDEENSSVSFKAGCNCINRYPDVPCECQKPHMTIAYPNQNSGLDSVYDPMNPSANNNQAASF